MSALHQQAEIPVADPGAFGAVRSAIEAAFSSTKIHDFLQSIQRAGLRIRDFEGVLRKGTLGSRTAAQYNALGHADQGQIREYYLATLETVRADLRAKFYKLYAYY
ncbi:MAG TPA: hypothetical protein VGU23_01935 [Acidobacteriaceae bacterium]|nr:hypothetical protein [Acidobacteriaceae bacterium]